MRRQITLGRREFIRATTAAAGGLVLAGCGGAGLSVGRPPGEQHTGEQEEVTPAEDLMREHGLLRRVLLVYGEAARRLDANTPLPPGCLGDSAGMIRTFIEQYHEKLEEEHLFGRFRKAGELVGLVDTLFEQHRAGRRLTDETVRLSDPKAPKSPGDGQALAAALRQFTRMYAPHAAREDTVLFPAIRQVFSAKEYDALGDAFEDKEHALFGDKGFEKMVDRVAEVEKALGIYDLSQFTPRG